MAVKLVLELWPVVLQTLVIYLFLIVALSLIGHRQVAEISITELSILMVMGSAVETAMVAGNTSLSAGLVSASTLLICNYFLSRLLRRHTLLRRIVVGQPIPLVYKGRYLPKRIDAAGLTDDDVMEGIRERGYENLDQVRLAVLEIDGSISVIPYDEKNQKEASKSGKNPE